MDLLLSDAIKFYQVQLHRHPEAAAYLARRGGRQSELVEQMRIGYAPGRCLRAWLMSLGYSLCDLQQAGVVTREGLDTFAHRIVFPLDSASTDAASAALIRIGFYVAARAGSIPEDDRPQPDHREHRA